MSRLPNPLRESWRSHFKGEDADEAIPNLIVANDLTGGLSPSILVQTVTIGGIPIGTPTLIASVPNSVAAIERQQRTSARRARRQSNQRRNRPRPRRTPEQSSAAWQSKASASASRSPVRRAVGDLIQGNSIGEYLAYPVDPADGLGSDHRPTR